MCLNESIDYCYRNHVMKEIIIRALYMRDDHAQSTWATPGLKGHDDLMSFSHLKNKLLKCKFY